jgi:hypothetical protein
LLSGYLPRRQVAFFFRFLHRRDENWQRTQYNMDDKEV